MTIKLTTVLQCIPTITKLNKKKATTGLLVILSRFIKDLSSETPDIETYLFVKDRIAKYQLGIDINSKAIKNKMIEINTTFKFEDREENKRR